jgi:hypothetical protein
MHSKPIGLFVLAVAGLLPYTTGGCGGSLLDSLPSADSAGLTEVLNQLTAGDLAEAFDDFRGEFLDAAGSSRTAGFLEEQRAAIEELQRRLDAGEITQDEFIAGVVDALQDTVPNSPFAGFRFLGSPFSAAGVNDFAEMLGLSQEQQQQALLIYRVLHGDIEDVRAAAQDQIRALLSTQQRVVLDQVATELFDQIGIPVEQRAGARLVFDLMVQRLGLTLDQQTQIETIRADLRDVVQQLHAGARAQFGAILSDAQLPILGLIEGLVPPPGD